MLPSPTAAVRTQGLSHAYGDVRALEGLDLEVERGRLFALLGPNGAGKSTTISILTTLLAPTAGDAFVAGYDVRREARSVRMSTGVVFQDVSLDDRLTARENLVLHAAIYGVPRAERTPRALSRLEWIGLSASADRRVRTFSGGMRRRLEIARALVHEPAVLVLDEPTVGLDPQTRRVVWDHLLEIARSRERTVFVTTHYMDEAERCDDVAIIDHGRLVARGSPRELIARAGPERVLVTSDDDDRAAREAEALGFRTKRGPGGVEISAEAGDAGVERILARLAERGLGLREVRVLRPRLEDAFVAVTGHAMRDSNDEGAGQHDAMRTNLRARGRRA